MKSVLRSLKGKGRSFLLSSRKNRCQPSDHGKGPGRSRILSWRQPHAGRYRLRFCPDLSGSRTAQNGMAQDQSWASSTGRKAGCERVIQKDVTLGVRGAREIEADEESSATDELLGRWAKQRPEPRSPIHFRC